MGRVEQANFVQLDEKRRKMSILAWVLASIISVASITPVVNGTIMAMVPNSCESVTDQAALTNYPNLHVVTCIGSDGKKQTIYVK